MEVDKNSKKRKRTEEMSNQTDYSRPLASIAPNCNYSPDSPLQSVRARYFAKINSDPESHSSIPPDYAVKSAYMNTCDNTCNNENRQDNLQVHQEESRNTNALKPTENHMKDNNFARDMKILCEYVQSPQVVFPDDEHDVFVDTLQRLSVDYVQGWLKERDLLKSFGNDAELKKNCDFILNKLDSMTNIFRLANGSIGISKVQQDALLASEKAVEEVRSQLIEFEGESTDCPSVSSSCELLPSRLNEEPEEAPKEGYMLYEQLAGKEIELKVRKEINDQMNAVRLDNGTIGISIQDDFLATEKAVEDLIRSQLTDFEGESIGCSSVSPPCEVLPPRLNEELEEAKKEVYMLLEQLAGTQMELEKVRKEIKNQMDVNPKELVLSLLEIRASLVEKVKCSEISKKAFAERITAEQIIFDIKFLIKNKLQFNVMEGHKNVHDTAHSSKVQNVSEYEVHLVTMIASFLRTISFPVNLDFIYSYVEKLDNALTRQYIESLLKKYPTFFREESVGAGPEKKWCYLELKPIITI